jgi:hypothetical protein
MFQLNDDQVQWVHDKLLLETCPYKELSADLLDHICCDIEERMRTGIDLETAFQEAVERVIPNGLREIEFELFFAMNYKRQYKLKLTIFLIGFLSLVLLSLGFLCALLRWKGAQVMIVTGWAFLLVCMLFIALYHIFFVRHSSYIYRLRVLAGLASGGLLALGFLLRYLHLPMANPLCVVGAIILNFVFLPMLFLHAFKNDITKSP